MLREELGDWDREREADAECDRLVDMDALGLGECESDCDRDRDRDRLRDGLALREELGDRLRLADALRDRDALCEADKLSDIVKLRLCDRDGLWLRLALWDALCDPERDALRLCECERLSEHETFETAMPPSWTSHPPDTTAGPSTMPSRRTGANSSIMSTVITILAPGTSRSMAGAPRSQ